MEWSAPVCDSIDQSDSHGPAGQKDHPGGRGSRSAGGSGGTPEAEKSGKTSGMRMLCSYINFFDFARTDML